LFLNFLRDFSLSDRLAKSTNPQAQNVKTSKRRKTCREA